MSKFKRGDLVRVVDINKSGYVFSVSGDTCKIKFIDGSIKEYDQSRIVLNPL
jgi:hypothetical protein